MATATRKTETLEYEDRVTGVTLELSVDEATELSRVISDIYMHPRAILDRSFARLSAIREALIEAGFGPAFGYIL